MQTLKILPGGRLSAFCNSAFLTSTDIPESDQSRLYPVSCYEIQRILMSFSSNKAPGLDKVSMSVIKGAIPCILPILSQIVNCSLLTSVFPTACKKQKLSH